MIANKFERRKLAQWRPSLVLWHRPALVNTAESVLTGVISVSLVLREVAAVLASVSF